MRPNPYLVKSADALRARIEEAAGVTVNMRHILDDDYDDGFRDEYWHAWVNRETDHAYAGGMTSRTIASATGNTDIGALDSLARQLGVFDRLNSELRDQLQASLAEAV